MLTLSQDSLEVRSSEAVAEAVSVKLWKRHTDVQPGTLHTAHCTLCLAHWHRLERQSSNQSSGQSCNPCCQIVQLFCICLLLKTLSRKLLTTAHLLNFDLSEGREGEVVEIELIQSDPN